MGFNVILNWTHQFLVYVADVNLLEDNTNTIKKYTEAVTDDRKECGLEENTVKPMYMFMSCHQNARQS